MAELGVGCERALEIEQRAGERRLGPRVARQQAHRPAPVALIEQPRGARGRQAGDRDPGQRVAQLERQGDASARGAVVAGCQDQPGEHAAAIVERHRGRRVHGPAGLGQPDRHPVRVVLRRQQQARRDVVAQLGDQSTRHPPDGGGKPRVVRARHAIREERHVVGARRHGRQRTRRRRPVHAPGQGLECRHPRARHCGRFLRRQHRRAAVVLARGGQHHHGPAIAGRVRQDRRGTRLAQLPVMGGGPAIVDHQQHRAARPPRANAAGAPEHRPRHPHDQQCGREQPQRQHPGRRPLRRLLGRVQVGEQADRREILHPRRRRRHPQQPPEQRQERQQREQGSGGEAHPVRP